MMKTSRFFLTALTLAVLSPLSAQTTFPLSAKQDKEGIMSKAYWKLWNPKVQAKIDKDIEQNRKADAVITLADAKPGTEVKVEQTKSDFIFGAHIFNFDQLGTKERNDRYKSLFGTLFNRATVGFYWKQFETRPGRKRYREEYWDTEDWWNHQDNPNYQAHWRRPSTDKVVDFLEKKGVAIHGHPLIWGNERWQQPAWLYRMFTPEEKKVADRLIATYPDPYEVLSEVKMKKGWRDSISDADLNTKLKAYGEKLNKVYEMRIRDLIAYYGKRIGSWDVVNESATDYAHGNFKGDAALMKSDYGIMPGGYTYKAFKTADDCFPQGVWKNINDYWTGPEYAKQVKDLLSRGAKIDIVGSQMHLFDPKQCTDIAAGKEIQTPSHVWNLMSDLASTGLPLCLSEITITSPSLDHKGQMIQAIIAYNLYRIWFSIKEMKAITWWNVVDGCGAPGEPSVSGLFTRDMQPKMAYYALNDLINNQWKTRMTVKTDNNGQIKFRGFRGLYKITYTTKEGTAKTIDYHVK
jgi:GH35 family endo-1,4-beta-xylanase